jgi:hypothetical protein
MAPTVLKVAMAFGGSMNFGNRHGIARFGMGMKTAALSMSAVLEVYSWQEPEAIYTMMLDVEAIGKERANLVELPEPTLLTELSDEVAGLFYKPMSCPTNRTEQHLLATEARSVADNLGSSGTIVYMPDCDRLHYVKAKTLVAHAVKEMARVYRRAIASGLRLYVNNRLVEAFDPTYSMPNARHTRFLEGCAKQSKLIISKPVPIPLSEDSVQTGPAIIKIYKLPIDPDNAVSAGEALRVARSQVSVEDWRIISRVAEGHSFGEVSKMIGSRPGSLRVRVMRCRQRLGALAA